jgi:lysylphosphatidylglycerol synthetase-like protein (DUF2156 family)
LLALLLLQVSAEFAAVLQSCSLLVNSMGGETVLDLATYTFSGLCSANWSVQAYLA